MVHFYRLHFLRFFLFFLILVVFTVLQSSIILQDVSPNAVPQLWIILIAYLSIYQNPILTVIMIYFTALFYSTLTSFSFAQILILSSMVFLFAHLSDKVNLKNKNMFFLYCSLFVLFLPLLNWMIAPLILSEPGRAFSIIDLIVTALLTFVSSIIIHFLFLRLESWIQKLAILIERKL